MPDNATSLSHFQNQRQLSDLISGILLRKEAMLVYRAFTKIGRLINYLASCFLSLFFPFHALLDGHEDGLFLWDFMYLRSRLLQAHFNYRLNYRAYERGNVSELQALRAKCGIWHEKHANVDRCATSGGQVDLYRLSSRNTTSTTPQRTVVLIHGILQSIDVFTCGGQSSIVAHFLRTGCDVWLLHKSHQEADVKQRSVSATPTLSGLRSPGLVEAEVSTALPMEEKTLLTCANLVAAAQFIDTYHQHTPRYSDLTASNTAVCWVAHSTGCEAILTALSYKSTVHASVTAELRRRTSAAVLLSPLLTLTHLNVHARGASGSSGGMVNTVLLHEVLLHSPDATYSLLGQDTLLQSLQQWRDILTPRTYSHALIAPLCRYALGWTFVNIAPHRRAELLAHLLLPTPTAPLVSLLCASHGHQTTSSFVYSAAMNVHTACRWWWRYTLLLVDVSLRLVGYVLGAEVSVFGLGLARNAGTIGKNSAKNTSRFNSCNYTATGANTSSITSSRKPVSAKRSSSYSHKPKIISFVGSHDALCYVQELEQRLAALAEQYSFENDVRQIGGYEHMDTLWADTAPELVFDLI